jgi:hypothetical protein
MIDRRLLGTSVVSANPGRRGIRAIRGGPRHMLWEDFPTYRVEGVNEVCVYRR